MIFRLTNRYDSSKIQYYGGCNLYAKQKRTSVLNYFKTNNVTVGKFSNYNDKNGYAMGSPSGKLFLVFTNAETKLQELIL
jgi:hypothetical protein